MSMNRVVAYSALMSDGDAFADCTTVHRAGLVLVEVGT